MVVLRSDRHEDAAIGNHPFSAWSETPGQYAALHLLLVHELSRQSRSKRDHDQPFRSAQPRPEQHIAFAAFIIEKVADVDGRLNADRRA